MTGQMDAILLNANAGQFLLGEQEQAFVSCCDEMCVVSNGTDGWPTVRIFKVPAVSLDVVNSRAVTALFDTGAWGGTDSSVRKVVLILTRHSDGVHLMLHGHLVPTRNVAEGEENEYRTRISIASCSWSPAVSCAGDAALLRALAQR